VSPTFLIKVGVKENHILGKAVFQENTVENYGNAITPFTFRIL